MLSKGNIWKDDNLIKTLKEGGVVVMPTDTLYGIVGRAENQQAVSRIYEIRKRNPSKPCIILISELDDLRDFSVSISSAQRKTIEKYWPVLSEAEGSFDSAQDKSFDGTQDFQPTSIVFDCPEDRFEYLHRGTYTLAFRLPASIPLRNLLKETGPLIAPSANPEGMNPSSNIREAKEYFGDSVDLYADGGELSGRPSKVLKLHSDSSVTILRE